MVVGAGLVSVGSDAMVGPALSTGASSTGSNGAVGSVFPEPPPHATKRPMTPMTPRATGSDRFRIMFELYIWSASAPG